MPSPGHDLVFDAGLQFRMSVSSRRRKRDCSENYWSAVSRELISGCTCVSFDFHGKPHPVVCACKQVPMPSHAPMPAFSTSLNVLTLRTPSRIRALLSEFLQVLISVIQPLTSMSGVCINPSSIQSQMRAHAAHASYLCSIFDPELIEQELKHHVFDPSGMFRLIGDTLKSHCAPMRDRAVDSMVELAQSCAPHGGGGTAKVVKVIRMCLDILELMKLVSTKCDIGLLIRHSNHWSPPGRRESSAADPPPVPSMYLRSIRAKLLCCL